MWKFVPLIYFNPLTPRSDQHIDSPSNFDTLSSRQVMRIEKIINLGYCLDITPNSQYIPNKEMYSPQIGELAFRSWD